MKQQTLLSRLLLPVLVVLILLPPLSCLIFQQAAARYAYGEATGDLADLQQNILPLMENSFAGQTDTPEEASEQVGNFLRQAGPLAHRMGGRASLMILGPDFRMVYPRDEGEREDAAPLAEAWAQAIQAGELSWGAEAAEWTDASGETWLVRIYEVPTQSVRLRYLVTYCSVSTISAWVNQTSLLVLVISGLFVLVAIGVLWVTARSVSRPLNRLCREAEKIGTGDFSEIAPAFSLRELEQLRASMNGMARQLQRSDQVQKDFFQNVSHELRNPLMSISGYAQGIEQGVFPAPKEAGACPGSAGRGHWGLPGPLSRPGAAKGRHPRRPGGGRDPGRPGGRGAAGKGAGQPGEQRRPLRKNRRHSGCGGGEGPCSDLRAGRWGGDRGEGSAPPV